MKRSSVRAGVLERIYFWQLIAVFGLIVLQAPISAYFGTAFPEHALVIKAWKELVMGELLLVLIVLVTRRRAWRELLRDPVIWLSALLAALYGLSLQYGHGFRPYAAGLLIDLRYILFGVLVYGGLRLFPAWRQLFLRVGLVSASVVVGFGLLQFVLPKDFLSVLGYSKTTITPYTTIDSYEGLVRLQSTLRGPNPLGAYAMMVTLTSGAILLTRREWGRLPRIGLLVLGIGSLIILYASYSRSAYLGLIAGGVTLAGLVLGRRLLRRRVLIGGAIGLVIVVGALLAIRTTTFYSSVLTHEVTGSGPSVNSDEGHSQSLSDGIKAVAARPLGYGTGSTGSASLLSDNGYIVENQYLFVAHEAGWVALLGFLALIGVLLTRAYRQRRSAMALGVFASGVGLLVVGLLLPVFADDTIGIVWFGLAALVAAQERNHEKPITK